MGILYQEKKNIGYWLQAFGLLQIEGLFYIFNKKMTDTPPKYSLSKHISRMFDTIFFQKTSTH